jgi:GGDEF domain-containing protein
VPVRRRRIRAELLTDTAAEQADIVASRLRTALLGRVRQYCWPVSFSIGLVTFDRQPGNVEEMVREADAAMYEIKRTTKNGIRHRVLPATNGMPLGTRDSPS